jgi:SNF2 family DNA or RNA helicase
MTRLKLWNAGACLADDMGLGKTVQAIAMMLHLAEAGPALVVCPASVVPNWGNELRKFAPSLNIHILKTGNREETFDSIGAFDVLVITYGLLQTEEERIAKTQWSMVVLDEAHAIKNYQTKSSKAAMNINAGFKLALTGTPIQNHLGELWNLFQFCNPGLLGTLNHFTERYVKNDLPSQKSHLKKLITPFILRRTKNKVLDELPPKTEITVSVELSKQEMAFYETLRREAIDTLENSSGPGGQQHLQALAEITKLRLACCNSSLVNKKIKLPSAKLEAFFGIIEELRANNHRALVFSQFVMHLAIVREALDQQGITYQYLDGSTSIPDREKAVKAFQSGKGELFLISLKAGGLGLNLTAADYVLHLDPWWNPAIEDQASDRAHRIGQTRPVTIYRLVARNTIEEKIVHLHATKRDLADNLLEGTDQSARLTTVDLLNLLKEV